MKNHVDIEPLSDGWAGTYGDDALIVSHVMYYKLYHLADADKTPACSFSNPEKVIEWLKHRNISSLYVRTYESGKSYIEGYDAGKHNQYAALLKELKSSPDA